MQLKTPRFSTAIESNLYAEDRIEYYYYYYYFEGGVVSSCEVVVVGEVVEKLIPRFQLVLQAYKQRLYGPKYVWFILGWYADDWYVKHLIHPRLVRRRLVREAEYELQRRPDAAGARRAFHHRGSHVRPRRTHLRLRNGTLGFWEGV